MKKGIGIVVVVLVILGAGAIGYSIYNLGGAMKVHWDEAAVFSNKVAGSMAKWDMPAVSHAMTPPMLKTYTLDGDQKWTNYKAILGNPGIAQPCAVPSISMGSKGTSAKAECRIDYPNGHTTLVMTIKQPGEDWVIDSFELRL